MTKTNPLLEASPSSIEDLWSKHPLEWTDEEIRFGVEYERKLLADWQVAEASGKTRGSKTPKKSAPSSGLDLKDLGID